MRSKVKYLDGWTDWNEIFFPLCEGSVRLTVLVFASSVLSHDYPLSTSFCLLCQGEIKSHSGSICCLLRSFLTLMFHRNSLCVSVWEGGEQVPVRHTICFVGFWTQQVVLLLLKPCTDWPDTWALLSMRPSMIINWEPPNGSSWNKPRSKYYTNTRTQHTFVGRVGSVDFWSNVAI